MKVCIMKKEKLDVIVCPTCGCEYLPAEIYLPNSFFGKPTNIEKTREGKVETFEGMTMNPNESYICDHCGTHFNVKANITRLRIMTIEIEEKQTKHVPGITSLFITFPYDTNLIEIVKSFGTAVYDKKNHTWELPSVYLSAFLDKACHIGDINLKLLRDKPDTNKIYTLSDYKIKPLDHQVEAIQYGLNHDKFLLLDAPGLGKTASIIHIAEELYKQHKIEHCLVICGLNTLKMNWVKEIKKHCDLSYRVLGQKISKKGKFSIGSVAERLAQLSENISEFFVITNIETLRDKKIASAINKNKPNVFDMIVLDEAHVCKNPSSQQGNNLLKLKKAKHQIAATGTVLLNDPIDCLVPLRWIGAENSCKSVFEHFYYQYGGDYGNQIVGFKNLDILKDQLSKYSIRWDKSLLNLPPKTIIPEYVEMDDTQAKFYSDISHKIVEEVDKVAISTVSLLAMVPSLRQATAAQLTWHARSYQVTKRLLYFQHLKNQYGYYLKNLKT